MGLEERLDFMACFRRFDLPSDVGVFLQNPTLALGWLEFKGANSQGLYQLVASGSFIPLKAVTEKVTAKMPPTISPENIHDRRRDPLGHELFHDVGSLIQCRFRAFV